MSWISARQALALSVDWTKHSHSNIKQTWKIVFWGTGGRGNLMLNEDGKVSNKWVSEFGDSLCLHFWCTSFSGGLYLMCTIMNSEEYIYRLVISQSKCLCCNGSGLFLQDTNLCANLFEIIWGQFSLISESSFGGSWDGFLLFWGVPLNNVISKFRKDWLLVTWTVRLK